MGVGEIDPEGSTKMADSLDKHSPFRQKNVWHYYECMLLVKLLCRTRIINSFWVGVGIDHLGSWLTTIRLCPCVVIHVIPHDQSH